MKPFPLAVLFCLAVSNACSSVAPPTPTVVWPDAARGVMDPQLARLCTDAWEFRMRESPIEATELGDPRYHGKLEDNSREGDERRARETAALLERAGFIPRSALSRQDRITLDMLVQSMRSSVREDDLDIDVASWNMNPRGGPQIDFPNLGLDQPVATAEERAQLLERWQAMALSLDRSCANLRRGLARGRVTSRRAAEEVVACLDVVLATPIETSILVAPAKNVGAAERSSFEAAITGVVRDRIYPAFARYRECVRDEVLPRTRDDDHPGVKWIGGGAEYYRLCIERHTSLELSPEEIHEFGLAEIARIRREIGELGAKVFGTSDVSAIQERLRNDSALHFETADEILETAKRSLARADAAVPAVFGLLPKARCIVVPIPDHEAPFTSIAYYRQPLARARSDAERNGRYFVNVYEPRTRPRYEAEALAFHEAVPGHHLQVALSQELDALPLVRRHGGSTAFVEGWALYTERLADELRLYTSDVDRLGMLSYDAWRASRLVVDTGIHYFGWSRQQGIDYLMANTLLARNNVENEVDRYIAWPGQALAYKIGQREILDLRAEAQARLGARFDLKAFHDRVLENGPVTLGVLRAEIEAWIPQEEARP